MALTKGNRREKLPRPGTLALELLANPLNTTILKQLSDGPQRLAELRRGGGGAAPQTTVRAHLKELERANIATLQSREGYPGVVKWALTDGGRDLLDVAAALEGWLQRAPDGPLLLGSDPGKMAVTALLGGWSSTALCHLAAEPLTLTELAERISDVSYPSLERRLSAMRLVGQVQASSNNGNKGTPYEVTEWLQEGVVPLAAAIRWEYAHRPSTVPLTRTDTQAAFLLALPLLRLAPDLNGICGLGVEVDDGDGGHCGASARVEKGKVVSCSPSLEDDVDASATGTPPDWAHAMLEASTDRLEIGGKKKLAVGLVEGLHRAVFGDDQRAPAPR